MRTIPKRDPLRTRQVPVTVQGVWLRREVEHAVVLVERDGRWIEIIREHIDGPFSHIVEPAGIRRLAP